MVACCAVLHNICLAVGDELQEDPGAEEEDEEDQGQGAMETTCGTDLRRLLAAQVSALQQAPMDHDYFAH